MALVPGLVNAHTHAAMTLFRGYADDLPLMEWLTKHIWPVEKQLDDEDIYWGTRLACVEMIRTGTTSFWDMYWRAEATARAVEDAGVRAVAGSPLIDDGDPAKSERACADAERSLARVAEANGALARPGFAPHAIYSLSERSLRWIAERANELDVPVQIHLSETEEEVNGSLAEHGKRPAFYLDEIGMLGPRTLLAHGCWLDRSELDLIAERGATVVTNPVANLKLAVGRVFPYTDAREAGVALGLGTDGPGSNNSLDLLASAKAFALLQKERGARSRGRHGVGDAGDRHRPALAAAQRAGARGRGARRLPARALRRPRARAGRARRRARLRRVGGDRRHDGGRRARADARRRGRLTRPRWSAARASARRDWG